MSKIIQGDVVTICYKSNVNLLKDLLHDIGECEYTTRAQVVGHINNELERVKKYQKQHLKELEASCE